MSQLNLDFHLITLAYCTSRRSIWEWNSGSPWTTFLVAGCQHMTSALNLTMNDVCKLIVCYFEKAHVEIKFKRKETLHNHRNKRTKELHNWKSWWKKRKVCWGRKVFIEGKKTNYSKVTMSLMPQKKLCVNYSKGSLRNSNHLLRKGKIERKESFPNFYTIRINMYFLLPSTSLCCQFLNHMQWCFKVILLSSTRSTTNRWI